MALLCFVLFQLSMSHWNYQPLSPPSMFQHIQCDLQKIGDTVQLQKEGDGFVFDESKLLWTHLWLHSIIFCSGKLSKLSRHEESRGTSFPPISARVNHKMRIPPPPPPPHLDGVVSLTSLFKCVSRGHVGRVQNERVVSAFVKGTSKRTNRQEFTWPPFT